MPTCYAPVRRAPPVLLQARTRLACVKHAASVRSEPGSNSRLKLVAWRKKIPGFASQAACQANYCRSIYSDHSGSKSVNGFERILAHRIDCQRAKPPCPAERHTHNLKSISGGAGIVNRIRRDFHRLSNTARMSYVAMHGKMRDGELRVARAGEKISGARQFRAAEHLLQRLAGRHSASWIDARGDRVGVAVSGGADSVALLLLLVGLREKLGLTLSVLHFNHKLRGRAADADEKFVARLGAANIGCRFIRGTAACEGDRRNATERIWRIRRGGCVMRFSRDARASISLDKIAVAHTADDQAETVLAHILRGSGLTGLGGIHPQVGKIVRPLLSVARGGFAFVSQSAKANLARRCHQSRYHQNARAHSQKIDAAAAERISTAHRGASGLAFGSRASR